MNAPAANNMISELSDHVGARIGLSFPRERWGELEKKIMSASAALGFPDTASCIEWLLSSRPDKRKLEVLSSCLTVGETYFFRENAGLQALAEKAFPEIIRSHAQSDRRMRIWCAGCSTGEEPYSLAMMVSENQALRGWEVSILGTDVNQAFLRKAEAGIYTEWSFRGVKPGVREKFFRKGDGATFEIALSLKRMVTFAHLNLIDDVYPALLNNTNALDVILCRNVLMYLMPDHIRNVLLKFHRALLPTGWLLVNPVETPLVARAVFTPVLHAGAILYRKAIDDPARSANSLTTPTLVPARTPARRAPAVIPPQPAPTYEHALELHAKAEYDGAIEILTLLAAGPSAGAPVFELLSRAYANTGALSLAETWCARSIAADPMNASCRYLMALIRIEQERPDDAVSALRKALYLEPDFVVAHITLANLYRKKGNRGESERLLRNALVVLQNCHPDAELPEAEGMTPGSLVEMIRAECGDGG
jgi:chemotaxis protein methyltransferase CheR